MINEKNIGEMYMEFLQTNRGKTAYQYFQSNKGSETLVLAHGIGLDMTTWEPILPYLNNYYNILVFDFRGHGYSDSFNEGYNWRILFEDFLNLLEHLSIDNYHFVAHGLGFYFIINLLNDSREVTGIQSITSISSPGYYPVKIATKGINVRKELVQQHGHSKLADILIKQLLHKPSNKSTELIKKSLERTTEDTYFSLFEMCINELSTEKLMNINVPVLLLSGELDVNYPPKLALMTTNYYQNNKYYIVPDSSNMIHLDKPLETAHFINKFIEEHSTIQKQESSNFDYIEELNNTLDSMIIEGFEKVNNSSTFIVNIMNGFYIEVDGVELRGKWNQRKAKSIMVYLALNGQVTREKLCDVFWFDLPIVKALKNVRITLNHIKNIFRESNFVITEYIEIDNEKLSLKKDVRCDVVTLISMFKQVEKLKEDEEKKREYIKLLDQLSYPIFDGLYDDWVLEIRDNLEYKVIKALNFVICYVEKHGDIKAVNHYRTLLEKIDPFKYSYQ